jgi:hypothetical protein
MLAVTEVLVIAPWVATLLADDHVYDRPDLLQRNMPHDRESGSFLDPAATARLRRRSGRALRSAGRFFADCLDVLLAARRAKAAPEH